MLNSCQHCFVVFWWLSKGKKKTRSLVEIGPMTLQLQLASEWLKGNFDRDIPTFQNWHEVVGREILTATHNLPDILTGLSLKFIWRTCTLPLTGPHWWDTPECPYYSGFHFSIEATFVWILVSLGQTEICYIEASIFWRCKEFDKRAICFQRCKTFLP